MTPNQQVREFPGLKAKFAVPTVVMGTEASIVLAYMIEFIDQLLKQKSAKLHFICKITSKLTILSVLKEEFLCQSN